MIFKFLIDNVSIDLVDSIDQIKSPLYYDRFAELNENEFFIHIPDVANIKAENGNCIQIQPIGEIDVKTIELYLNGSVTGAILHQRKILPLHASSVEHEGKAIIFCGDSGAGKSTVTYGLSLQEGFDFLTDDITPIIIKDNTCFVNAISEQMKLWANSLDSFGMDISNLEMIRKDTDKYFVPLSSKKEYVEIGAIFFLKKSNCEEIVIEELKGVNKIQHLLDNVYRKEFLNGMKSAEISYFEKHTLIASSIKSYLLKRPENSNIHEVVDIIRTIITK